MCRFEHKCSINDGLCWRHIMSGIAPPSCKYQVSGQYLVRMIISQKSLRYSVAFTLEIVQLLMISDDGFSDDRWRVPHSCGCLRPTADSVFLINCYLTIHYTLHTHFTLHTIVNTTHYTLHTVVNTIHYALTIYLTYTSSTILVICVKSAKCEVSVKLTLNNWFTLVYL